MNLRTTLPHPLRIRSWDSLMEPQLISYSEELFPGTTSILLSDVVTEMFTEHRKRA
jgi:hypothetical protein